MSYKSLFTVLTDKTLAGPALDQAIELARKYDAHLDVLCLGVDRTQTGYYYAGANAIIMQESITRAEVEAKELEAFAREKLGNADIRWGTEDGVAQLADIGRHIAARARFSDLVIMPKPYGKDHGIELEPTVEAALFEGQTPVLVLPDAKPPLIDAKTILIGWNESAESLNAVRAALPLLKMAEIVRIVVIDPPIHSASRSDPGGLLSLFLARHGVKTEIDVLSKTLPRVSDVLMRHARDTNADLMVMGAYGHSRFRESILGGATRNMLEQAPVHVFMAH